MTGSKPPNGSSNRRSDGSAASARATPTRCRWPPDNSRGKRPAKRDGSSPTSVSMSRTRESILSGGHDSRDGTNATFRCTVKCGNKPTSWMTYPMRRRNRIGSQFVVFFPSTNTPPDVGSRSRLISLSVVVLPDPLLPRSTTVSPDSIEKEMFSTRARPLIA